MAHILMLYGTTEGHTRKVVDFLAGLARADGHTVMEAAVESPLSADILGNVDGILLAGSIHMGRHSTALRRFAAQNRGFLSAVPSAFLSISISARDEAHRPEADGYLNDFLVETGWEPSLKGLAGGALRYTQYGPMKKFIVKRIARKDGLPTDATHDYEYTDWEELRGFGEEFLRVVQEHATLV